MNSRRTMTVVAAVVIGAFAALALFQYVRSADNRAYDNAKLVKAYVVKEDITKGLPGDQAVESFIESSDVPAKYRPATALTDINIIKGKVAISNLAKGQVIVDGMFVDAREAQVTFSQNIGAGRVAITISVDDVHGVAKLLVPGDKVNMLIPSPQDDTAMSVLYQNVDVLAVGDQQAPQPGETSAVTPSTSGLITFSVPAEAASRIARASSAGNIYLTLVPPDNTPVEVPDINSGNQIPPTLTPYG